MKGKILSAIAMITMFGVVLSNDNKKSIPTDRQIVVALDTSNYGYFLQKGNPCGYQFELFELFAEENNVNLDFRIVPDSLKFDMLIGGDIDIAVFSEGFDSLYSVFNKYADICSSIPLDNTVKSVWLAREEDMPVILSINTWASNLKGRSTYNALQTKYFSRKHGKRAGGISPYDNILKKYSAEIDWDWRLAASIAYHESRFRPDVKAKSGTIGIMQLMPNTVSSFGVKNVYDPEENIKGGLKLIACLSDIFRKKGVPEDELTNFVLAAYNAGHGKIFNFMKEAENMGFDKNRWKDVASVILLKSQNRASTSPKSKFTGRETLKFVDNVLKNYNHYKNFYGLS
ncbi:MAG: transglycosylase SLT domain-containing protein [Prevotellaceae bacterium]|jgi:membrane-bound lytic murein transglycosylase F|nr:transglycosylase SLT domain-containing protein [Prevotellaceae bacterium]